MKTKQRLQFGFAALMAAAFILADCPSPTAEAARRRGICAGRM